MPKLVLTYFDFDGGRGEPARLALHLGGIAFEDRRVGFKEWDALRDRMPFRALPVLEVAGRVLAQSNSINRYVGKLAGLYPKDDLQAFLCDEAMDAVEDMDTPIGATIDLPPEEKKQAREELAAGLLPRYLAQLQARLEAAGGAYFAGGSLSVGDLKVWMMVRWLRGGVLDAARPRGPGRAAAREARRAPRGAAEDRGVLRGAEEVGATPDAAPAQPKPGRPSRRERRARQPA
jgi:prostaglandin-H2 D-isomerase / glutathione transferase